MSQYGWEDCPPETSRQTGRLILRVERLISENLLGFYLHGSLAMGCFNPARSDLDFLVVTRQLMGLEDKKQLAGILLNESLAPHPIEISFLPHEYLIPWEYPTRFDFHYSETWRENIQGELENSNWLHWNDQVRRDPDLAAHITITRQRGICLSGAPTNQVLPEVPSGDYMASILNDVEESLAGEMDDPVYSILNLCRVWAYKRDGLICSKQEGGLWALNFLPVEVHPLIREALGIYAGRAGPGAFEPGALESFLAFMRTYLAG